jgi:hypothetical protein
MSTRREFLKAGAVGLGVAWAGTYAQLTTAAPTGPLIDKVQAVCRRLGAAGWRQMLLDVTGGEFDMLAADLKAELARNLSRINRGYPGFGDFAMAGHRGIEPGQPDYSLLYHALAAPSVVSDRNGAPLKAFATLAEIDAVESYVYAARRVSLNDLRGDIGKQPVAIVTFATQYRNAPMAVNGCHAQLCFSRAGIGRIGNLEPHYDPRLRAFVGSDESHPFDFHVVPRRFSHYLAVQMPIDPAAPDRFGPQDRLESDDVRQFWVPLHKLFDGPECLAGMDLQLILTRGMLNDELAAFHRFLDEEGLQNNWTGQHLQQFPFAIRDERIASLSSTGEFGPGVLIPRANTMVEEAHYQGARLTFPVDPRYSGKASNLQLSSLFVLPGGRALTSPQYLHDAEQNTGRSAPEYINIRHRVVNGRVDNLNDRPHLMDILKRGNYEAQHYIDFSGDGWVAAGSVELAKAGIATSKPAFCMIGLPDFLPKLGQRELMLWWNRDVPEALRKALWATPPWALSQTRIAANIELPAGFTLDDDTVSAIVSQPQGLDRATTDALPQLTNGPMRFDKTGLPDGSPGLFDPGWDSSMGVAHGPTAKLQRFLVSHGLGSPFIEDAKLCAALGSYWPGVVPDATRQYQPDKWLSGISYPWPTAVPFTDEEIGIVPVAQGPHKGKLLSWDGVRGPRRATFGGQPVIEYANDLRVDYIDLQGRMTAALTSRIDLQEYQARTLAMAAVYWSLGIRGKPDSKDNVNQVLRDKASWAVLSFAAVPAEDAALQRAVKEADAQRETPWNYYRFEVFRWGKTHNDPSNLKVVFVEILEEATAYTNGGQVILKRNGAWKADNTIPT